MKKYFVIVCISLAGLLNAQVKLQEFTSYYMFNLGYTYNNFSYANLGANVYLVQPNNNLMDLGVRAKLSYPNSKLKVIPEAQVGYHFNFKNTILDPYSPNFNGAFWVVSTSVSPWDVTPEIGISLLDLIEFTTGYGFQYRDYEGGDLSGLKLGMNIKLPFLLFWHD